MSRVYLDHNATTPVRAEARAAMAAACDILGNPSSVHAEGRQAKAFLEGCRARLARALGAEGAEIVFTGSASEAAAMALAGRGMSCSGVEHDAVASWCDGTLATDAGGRVSVPEPGFATLQLANSETGVLQELPEGLWMSDFTQGFGKVAVDFLRSGPLMAIVSAHKLGGPKGVGALVMRRGIDLEPVLKGGGQEMGRRAGTENLIGIAGFAAAAEAAVQEQRAGRWAQVEALRDEMEAALAGSKKPPILVGKDGPRLPNTSCLLRAGWKGETQVMQMDLAGYAISAGSACSSGKVKTSPVLRAMGYGEAEAGCGIRVSLGLESERDDILRFAEVWAAQAEKQAARAA
ncbi:aminotransferase class V-fold PLP-dependent enzyme [uncultured Lentibacter sp.]|uniref:cysteine desulfurase family protein n=1 Tax=uncultured Lentibacter sp. TaxID=1659309 RepID=UPI00262D01D2|nr:aminotransferase class V-fold PLP-dependent enzyme [uncultured Lentibacter sp.]MCW1955061.1 aminotransferase class V-fold PLP-dependent enzyme [Roseobacter sp.]